MKSLSVVVEKSRLVRVEATPAKESNVDKTGKVWPAKAAVPAYDAIQIKARIGLYLIANFVLPKDAQVPVDGEVLLLSMWDDKFDAIQVLLNPVSVSLEQGEAW